MEPMESNNGLDGSVLARIDKGCAAARIQEELMHCCTAGVQKPAHLSIPDQGSAMKSQKKI